MTQTWILISDTRRARCFAREEGDHVLIEHAAFVYPYAETGKSAVSGGLKGGLSKGHGRTGHAGTQFEPHTEPSAKGRNSFARQLAAYLNKGVAAHLCDSLVLIATSPMLGEIRPYLNAASEKALKHCVTSDLTHYTGPELQTRVEHALQLPN